MAKFDESKHPRDEQGKFTNGKVKEFRQNTPYEEIIAGDRLYENERNKEDEVRVLNKTGISKKKKGIRSLNIVIEKHKNKIKNPELYIKEWVELTEIDRANIIEYWKKEIRRYEKQIERIKKEIGE